MIETLQKERFAKIIFILFIFFTIWWVAIQFPPFKTDKYIELFGEFYGSVALLGAIFSITIAKHWGGTKSVIGKSLYLFTLGLFAQAFGQIAYSYFVYVLKVDVPYPSLGDVGYFGSIPLYALGVYYLAKASGASLKLKKLRHQLVAILLPLLMLAVGYFLFLQNYVLDWSSPIKVFLDFAYPLGQAIYISLAINTYLLSKGVLGGVMKNKILFILFALFIQFLSDYTFLYQTLNETWSVGGINDYLYLLSYFLMSIGLLQFSTVLKKLKG